MINYKIRFFKNLLIFLSCIFFVGCNNLMDYNSIIEKYSSEELLCASLLEIEGVNIFLGEPFTGSCLIYNSDYTRKTELQSYVNGKVDGVVLGFFPSGEVEFIGHKKNGEINGDYIKFYENGKIAITGQFSDGLYIGTFKYFDENGKLIEKSKYNNYGKLLQSKTY